MHLRWPMLLGNIMSWLVQVKGYIDREEDRENGEIEVSVIRQDNKHGRDSYGWADENKIILPEMNPGTRQQYMLLVNMATIISRALNEAEI